MEQNGSHRLRLSTRLAYGVGAVAFGVKDNGFSSFLLIFYNQILGLPVAEVGLAVMAALVIDALFDPVIGQVSDNWHSSWGRRHPFMYFAAIPASAAYLFLWLPPTGWSHDALFGYLLILSILIRTLLSIFEIPSAALAAELTSSYDIRTKLLSYRFVFGWVGGIATSYVALRFFLQPDRSHAIGQLNPAGYPLYGYAGSGLILSAILICAFGTHREIPFLRKVPKRNVSLAKLAREMAGTFSNASFIRILLANVFVASTWGLFASLNLYFATFFWELGSSQVANFSIAYLMGAICAFGIAPILSERLGKKHAAMVTFPVGVFTALVPIVLRIFGYLPANGSALIFPLLYVQILISTGCTVSSNILTASMIADVVEDSELLTGRRSEGLFFAATAFVAKAVTGIGIFASAMLLSVVSFPNGARPGAVDPSTIRDLGLVYVPTMALLATFAVTFLKGYRITRESHSESLKKLAANAAMLIDGDASYEP